jgi:GNAT superfamily N-acetyltransferase
MRMIEPRSDAASKRSTATFANRPPRTFVGGFPTALWRLSAQAATWRASTRWPPAGIPNTALPSHVTKRLPRYQLIPAVQVGRLAVDLRYRGRKLGSVLLADAAVRSARADPAAFTLLVDAKDEGAAAFYRKHGFTPLASRPLTLFLPIATALKLLS